MEAYWDRKDCDLDATVVEALLRAYAPDTAFHSIGYLSEGWDSWAYVARDPGDHPWVFRFPKRAWVVPRLELEIRLLPALAQKLPLPIPRFEVVGSPSELYPHPFVGYEMLPGTPGIEAIDLPIDVAASGRELGRLLAALHAFPADEALAAGIPPAENDGALLPNGWSAEALDRQLSEFGSHLPASVLARARELAAHEVPSRERVALVHHDLFPEHILLRDGVPSGIIDWGDVALADPAADFAGLFYWAGEPLLAATIEEYRRHLPARVDVLERMVERARILAVFRAGEDLEFGTQAGRDDFLQMALHALRVVGA